MYIQVCDTRILETINFGIKMSLNELLQILSPSNKQTRQNKCGNYCHSEPVKLVHSEPA